MASKSHSHIATVLLLIVIISTSVVLVARIIVDAQRIYPDMSERYNAALLFIRRNCKDGETIRLMNCLRDCEDREKFIRIGPLQSTVLKLLEDHIFLFRREFFASLDALSIALLIVMLGMMLVLVQIVWKLQRQFFAHDDVSCGSLLPFAKSKIS